MKKILILFAHPAFKRSTTNAALRRTVENIEGITFHDLYTSYPDFLIDVEYEQLLCETHDIIVFQHPFYWYSTPAILKEWLDLVLEHGWAYGSRGTALTGKYFLQALTAGGDDISYTPGGHNSFSIHELLAPLRATASLCKMIWLPPYAVLGVHRGLDHDQITYQAENYKRVLIALRDNRLDIELALSMQFLNSNLNKIIQEG